jgi:hypothetical protein
MGQLNIPCFWVPEQHVITVRPRHQLTGRNGGPFGASHTTPDTVSFFLLPASTAERA